jgi:S-adenosylmethionine hydrolase
MPARPITFLSDYGLGDEFVGVVHGVIAGICPAARIIDLGHGVPRQNVQTGALMLARALPFVPAGVHLAVVDPEVGARRRAVALRTSEDERLLVGPDNGLLLPAAEKFGGVAEAVEISASPWRLEPVSATFHGRDVFAPVAAHLATGVPIEALGPAIDPPTLVDLRLPGASSRAGGLDSAVLFIDSFGNCRLAGQPEDLAATTGGELRAGDRFRFLVAGTSTTVAWQPTFGAVASGEPLLYDDADYDGLAVAVNQGSAAARFGLAIDDPVRIEAVAG